MTLTRLVNFINGQFHSIHKQTEMGDTKTILLEKQMMELSRVISEKTSGKLETNAQPVDMGEIKNWEGFLPSRELISVAKSEVGNPSANLRAILGGIKI